MARPTAIDNEAALRLTLKVASLRLTDDQFYELCCENSDLRLEMTAHVELIIMSPTNPETGRKNARITARLVEWTERDGSGECCDSSAEFTLPDGSKRSPDGAWILKSRWNQLGIHEKSKFARICPDFVIELRSPSDRLADIQIKMNKYIANGASLGWLLDPIDNRAYVYRPSKSPQCIQAPQWIDGSPELPGFEFDFRQIL